MKFTDRRPLLLRYYNRYLDEQNTAAFIKQVSQQYTVGSLERLAVSPHREVRRSAIMALSFLADYYSNPVLGRALIDEDRIVRTLAENGIRNLWSRAGSETHRRRLSIATYLNLSQQHEAALRQATELLEECPWFAEAWNQRAISQYNLGRYAESIRDCHQALEINPYHYAAAAGMGQSYLQLGHRQHALESFRRALRLNPNMEAVRTGISYLERLLRNQDNQKKQ